LFIGPVAIGAIDEWVPSPGTVVSWHPSSASREKARQAPISPVPASYIQAQHLRGYCEQVARGLDYSRLLIVTVDMPGRCDVRAMSYVVNAHLCRHDTYRSWFEYKDPEHIVRRTMPDAADIDFVPTEHGEMTPAEMRHLVVSTPNPLQWDCFSFGAIQRPNGFTFYVSIDHLHMDAMFVAVAVMEFYTMYTALVGGSAPIELPQAGSYDDFCVRQRQYTSALTVESPEVRAWTQFAENNNGSFPDFPLPLGDPSVPCAADMFTVTLMNTQQTAQFESACIAAGARFIGGVLACAALAEHELTGAETYYGLTPSDTRSTPADFMTAGWFTGLVPITVPVGATSFGAAARVAQASFDSGPGLANVPFYRVLELSPWLTWPRPNFPVVNFFDSGAPPLSVLLTSQLDPMHLGIYSDGRYSYQMSIFVVRLEEETAVSVLYPKNAVARESVARYLAVMKTVYARVADGGGAAPLKNVAQA
jgi:mycolipenoyl-CoA---2-(long-chain-fatty acyl)-trehalose mycolipenoyltransferase / long-chain-acyl-CoA---trehalose acyltransferase